MSESDRSFTAALVLAVILVGAMLTWVVYRETWARVEVARVRCHQPNCGHVAPEETR